MSYNIINITTENYHLFDDMVYWRIENKERTETEKHASKNELKCPSSLIEPNYYIYAAKMDDKLVGWISVIFLPKVGKKNSVGFVYVDELWVEPGYRRKGIAQALMKKADDYCLDKKANGIRLGVNVNNPGAQQLYEQCGYESTGQAYTLEKRIYV